jgi:hypothetical protein
MGVPCGRVHARASRTPPSNRLVAAGIAPSVSPGLPLELSDCRERELPAPLAHALRFRGGAFDVTVGAPGERLCTRY